MRRPLMAGNWKMNKTGSETVAFIKAFKDKVAGVTDVDIMVAPPYTALNLAGELLKGTNIALGAQNMYPEKNGAYTGEISPPMLRECGCEWVIIGHSERRQYFGCTDGTVNKKLKFAVKEGLKPIVCIGESLQEREKGKTFEVLKKQLSGGLADLSEDEKEALTIAYEPVWAIGTGKTATPAQAEEAHKFIRNTLSEMFTEELAQNIRILYGGSIKPDNISDIMKQENVDGGLVGGASLEAGSFASIVKFRG
ncbi:MAG: triose-phosphate isomerase [Elusimicrobia bacterium]|nr:triose-phosphate isomerase [Elusimicrobiota bacterium]